MSAKERRGRSGKAASSRTSAAANGNMSRARAVSAAVILAVGRRPMRSSSSSSAARSSDVHRGCRAGLVGDERKGRRVAPSAAIRELEEETGYRAEARGRAGAASTPAGYELGRLRFAARRRADEGSARRRRRRGETSSSTASSSRKCRTSSPRSARKGRRSEPSCHLLAPALFSHRRGARLTRR